MSDLKISSDLFLGKVELNFLKKSLREEGYAKLFQQVIGKYGIVRSLSDTNFEALKVVQGTGIDKLTIKAGTAIDSDINIIDVDADLVDHITMPTDGITRYVIASYNDTDIEEGTININSTGLLTGTGTKFLERLRGLPDFPSRITFTNSVGNTQEYIVASVASDTSAQLNIAAGAIVTETLLKYQVVGTFTDNTPNIPALSKYPFRSDSYTIELRTSPTVIAGKEFLLANATTDGATTTILDQRDTITLLLNGSTGGTSTSAISPSNGLIGIENIKYDNSLASKDENLVKVGWGLRSENTQWGIAGSALTISIGGGGIFDTTADFTAGDFDGWKVVFESNGLVVPILTSLKSGSDIICNLGFAASYPTTGKIVVIPSTERVQLQIKSSTKGNVSKTIDLSAMSGVSTIKVKGGETVEVSYRHILGDNNTPFQLINDGDYVNETSYDTDGNLSSVTSTSYTTGLITTLKNADNFFERKHWLGKGSTVSNTTGNINIVGNYNAFRVELTSTTEFKSMTDRPEGTIVTLEIAAIGPTYESGEFFNNEAGLPAGHIPFFATARLFGVNTEYPDGTIVTLQRLTIGGTATWVMITSNAEVGNYQYFTQLIANLSTAFPGVGASSTYIPKITSQDIGAWNMDASVGTNVSLATLGIAVGDILSVSAWILSDTGSPTPTLLITANAGLAGGAASGAISISGGSIFLSRTNGGHFDNASYDDAVMNRGYITVIHK